MKKNKLISQLWYASGSTQGTVVIPDLLKPYLFVHQNVILDKKEDFTSGQRFWNVKDQQVKINSPPVRFVTFTALSQWPVDNQDGRQAFTARQDNFCC